MLDVAGGTGDIAFRIARAGGAGNPRHGRRHLARNGGRGPQARRAARACSARCDFTVGNAEALAFPDKSFDAYTIAFGIRNVTHIDRALAEAYRVLKPGGRFLCLEFSQVDVPVLDKVYDAYSFTVIPAIGKVVTGDGQPYRYLVESIRTFPKQDEFKAMIAAAGFANASPTAISPAAWWPSIQAGASDVREPRAHLQAPARPGAPWRAMMRCCMPEQVAQLPWPARARLDARQVRHAHRRPWTRKAA